MISMEFLEQQTSKRKLRLFAVACCQLIIHLLENEDSINAINVAERFADGLSSSEELNNAYLVASSIAFKTQEVSAQAAVRCTMYHASYAAFAAANRVLTTNPKLEKKQEQIVEDIFHKSILIIPTNKTVQAIARSIYWDKEWKEMYVLADAIEDQDACTCIAGIKEMLDHLRSNQEHWRGCWALDLILGYE